MEERQPLMLLELERELRGDERGELRDRLRAELADQAARVRRELFAGAPPERYRELEHLRDALERARGLIATVWARYHPDQER